MKKDRRLLARIVRNALGTWIACFLFLSVAGALIWLVAWLANHPFSFATVGYVSALVATAAATLISAITFATLPVYENDIVDVLRAEG